MNPYQSPEPAATEAKLKTRRKRLTFGELAIVACLIGGLCGVLRPAVMETRYRDINAGKPRLTDWAHQHQLEFLVLSVAIPPAIVFTIFMILRRVAPSWLKPHIRWFQEPLSAVSARHRTQQRGEPAREPENAS